MSKRFKMTVMNIKRSRFIIRAATNLCLIRCKFLKNKQFPFFKTPPKLFRGMKKSKNTYKLKSVHQFSSQKEPSINCLTLVQPCSKTRSIEAHYLAKYKRRSRMALLCLGEPWRAISKRFSFLLCVVLHLFLPFDLSFSPSPLSLSLALS